MGEIVSVGVMMSIITLSVSIYELLRGHMCGRPKK